MPEDAGPSVRGQDGRQEAAPDLRGARRWQRYCLEVLSPPANVVTRWPVSPLHGAGEGGGQRRRHGERVNASTRSAAAAVTGIGGGGWNLFSTKMTIPTVFVPRSRHQQLYVTQQYIAARRIHTVIDGAIARVCLGRFVSHACCNPNSSPPVAPSSHISRSSYRSSSPRRTLNAS